MSPSRQSDIRALRRRRYLVHLFAVLEGECKSCSYMARIHPWASRIAKTKSCERAFVDDCELISTINPLLPQGSDVRDVFEHIEGPNGFLYLLRLTPEEAMQLGWRPDTKL